LDADLLATQNIEIVPENEQLIWELRDWIVLFKNSIKRLSKRQASSPSNAIEFDKDDEDTLDLVASTANIRAHIFAIPKASKFDIKAMAGNIIPAIATTNAIAAAMIVIHARNILTGNETDFCNAYINYGSQRNAFTLEAPCGPAPDCSVCSNDRVLVKLNCNTATIKTLLAELLPRYLETLQSKFGTQPSIEEDDITVLESNRLLYDIDDDNGNGDKPLVTLKIRDSKILKIDFSPHRCLFVGIIQVDDENDSFEMEMDFDVIEPKNLILEEQRKRQLEESVEAVEWDEDELVCIDEKDPDYEIITEIDSKKKKLKVS
jgi:ubiquitin-like 1-activating enzyme E1 B